MCVAAAPGHAACSSCLQSRAVCPIRLFYARGRMRVYVQSRSATPPLALAVTLQWTHMLPKKLKRGTAPKQQIRVGNA
jgi:hypothetical protein